MKLWLDRTYGCDFVRSGIKGDWVGEIGRKGSGEYRGGGGGLVWEVFGRHSRDVFVKILQLIGIADCELRAC